MSCVATTISVALCTYNGAAYLPGQLASIAAQRRLPDEVVICDDGSADETVAIAHSFAARAPFPVQVSANPARLGVTKNFERAVSLCGGGIIAFCDQDDVWLDHKLQMVEAAFARRPGLGAAFSDAELVDETLSPIGRTLWASAGFGARARARFERGGQVQGLMKCTPALGLTLAFRSAFKAAVLPFHPDHGHDLWTVLIIAVLADVALIKEPLVKYRQHPNQLVGIRGPVDLGARLAATARITGEAHLKTAGLYEDVFRRLELVGVKKECMNRLTFLREKAAHLRARGLLAEQKWRRLPTVLRELGARRYHRYSNGLRSAAKDLLLT